MRTNYFVIIVAVILFSCNKKNAPVVDAAFTDSLISNYSISPLYKTTEGNFEFWKKRMDSLPDNYVNGPKYAGALSSLFHMTGNINYLLKADSLIKESLVAYQDREPGFNNTLAYLSIQQHQFNRADSLLKVVVKFEGQTAANAFLDFDVSFEKGDYRRSKNLLATLKDDNSYAYLFRKAKFEHYDGSLDSAISYMLKAAELARENKSLKQAALSNAADLCLHKGDLKKAFSLYKSSINIDAADMHSIMGIGWIALVHDKKDSLAEQIFQFVKKHSMSPDVLLKLMQVAEFRGDSLLQQQYAAEFITSATAKAYGNMYNKYLIDLYTTVTNEPAKAILLAEKELTSRATPQTYAWYVWSLYSNNEKEKAYTYFKSYVSAQPLEGLELYFMGRMMEGLHKKYNATEFYKVAWKNRYDLSPSKQKYLEETLE
ncbi:MAG: hypothetical protein ABIP79_04355 [Chitinophagaceae bacterium]